MIVAIRERQHTTGFRHIKRLTDDRGILEHAKGPHPRFHMGYCTDDNARLLIVCVRDTESTEETNELARIAARFVFDSQRSDGLVHNRMSFDRIWIDTPGTDDCWGRSLWALGEAVLRSADTELQNRCFESFLIGAGARSESLRSMCFAAIGAACILEEDARNTEARYLLHDARAMFAFNPDGRGRWRWPEPRLAYANAVIPEAMIACGVALGDDALVYRGTHLLDWLVNIETLGDHLSVTPAGGRGPDDVSPMFDQQPIEVAALADAAIRAGEATGQESWDDVVHMAGNWFLGNNDAGMPMIDLESGGGYDGLHADRVNINQGAESTLAMISTMQHRSALWLV